MMPKSTTKEMADLQKSTTKEMADLPKSTTKGTPPSSSAIPRDGSSGSWHGPYIDIRMGVGHIRYHWSRSHNPMF